MARDTGGNIAVDYVWGNIPMQPDDDRGMNQLNSSLGFHIIATSNYNGFPGHIPSGVYVDTIPNVAVPNLVGLTESAATGLIAGAALVKGTVTTADNYAGATAGNNGKVKSQSPAASVVVNEGSVVTLVVYLHTP
jgi:hypothetical protein